jgi:phosphatidylcholine synthase
MNGQQPSEAPDVTWGQQVRAYSVHLYTASGLVFAFLAMAEVCGRGAAPRPQLVFLWLLISVLVDATDGPLARAWHVKSFAPRIDGRKIDDIIDYLTFTFIPLMLVWRMEWLPREAEALIPLAMVASVFGFANATAKQETAGFFLGFPSYWNIYAFYVGLWVTQYGSGGRVFSAVLLALLSVLSVVPIRFLYPNLAPGVWRIPVLLGAAIWTVLLLLMLWGYPADVSPALYWSSLIYPAFYTVLSMYLDVKGRREE